MNSSIKRTTSGGLVVWRVELRPDRKTIDPAETQDCCQEDLVSGDVITGLTGEFFGETDEFYLIFQVKKRTKNLVRQDLKKQLEGNVQGRTPSHPILSYVHTDGEKRMSADWFYMKSGFFYRHKRIGPICEIELLTKIEKGEVTPETLLSSTSKTHGHWLAMREIKPAIKHWKQTHPGAA